MRTKWEYKVIAPEDHKMKTLERWLDEQGQNGWELIAITALENFIFKRPIDPPATSSHAI